MHRERSNQFFRSSDTDLRIDIASDRGCCRRDRDKGSDALLRCKKNGDMAGFQTGWVALSYRRAHGSMGTGTHACTVIAHCSSCQGQKCGVAATPLVDFQQYFRRFAGAIRDAGKAAGIHGSPMRIWLSRDFFDADCGRRYVNSAWANPVTDVRRACHDY